MTADRFDAHHETLRARLAAGDLPPGPEPEGTDAAVLMPLFEAQCLSRQLDRAGRAMQREGRGFYTIGSAGHEGMAAIAAALRPTDAAFLHYRDAAFQIARAAQVEGQDPARDILLSFACAASDPMSGGRHKVLGSRALNIPPQTSTIASHLPKAMGTAFAVGLSRRTPPPDPWLPRDAIVMASFGDASANHSTAAGAVNAACWTAHRGGPMPLLLVCEDNGIGISTPTPEGWIAAAYGHRPGLRYLPADGLDLAGALRAATDAADHVRRTRRPAFLHLRTVRLFGHAGSDVEAAYRPPAAIAAGEADDPLLHSARQLAALGVPHGAILAAYDAAGARLDRLANEVAAAPPLQDAAEVAAAIVPPPRTPPPARPAAAAERDPAPQPMARHVARALGDLMHAHPELVVLGQDVGRKGGVYGATRGLHARFGPARVIDTLLDEQSILGLAIGLAHQGYVPIPEIQFLAYYHNAQDQIRGEAATLPFFSNGQFDNPMVLRIAGLGYQRGFGGHFHNDNALAVLRDVPGLILGVPSDGAEAALMLREAVRLAREERRVVAVVEPIALYGAKDLTVPGDGRRLTPYPGPAETLAFGEPRAIGAGTDLAILTYGNGVGLSRQALESIDADARIVDVRWLAPLPEAAILDATAPCAATLVVDECRRSGGPAEALMALLAEHGRGPLARVTATDSFIATGPAAAATLPSADGIARAASRLLART